jgi:hypothetical protein
LGNIQTTPSQGGYTNITQELKQPRTFRKTRSESESANLQKEGWILFKKDAMESVYIHQHLYDTLGITAFKGPFTELENLTGPSSFSFNSRNLTFTHTSEYSESSANKAKALINQLQQFADKAYQKITQERPDVISAAIAPSINIPPLVKIIQEYANDDHDKNQNPYLAFNPKRRGEAFLPFTVRGRAHSKLGLHIYPWLSKKDKSEGTFNFTGFEYFTTALCMFGSSLKGVDQKGARFSLIKHDVSFFAGQKIVRIDVQQPNPYENAQLEDLERLTHLMRSLSIAEKTPKLYCHFPHYDYILFCLELVSANKMTDTALEQAVDIILIKTKGYIERINSVCQKQGIQATISSPFYNIFGDANTYDKTAQVLDQLSQIADQEQDLNEAHLVRNCLKLLTTNHFEETHRQVWQHFIQKTGEQNITTLESLFKIGNAVMIAAASYGKKAYEVCSLLALSEKQIQISYDELSKKPKPSYPAVVNLTYLDPCLGYSLATHRGNLFYFDESRALTSEIISKKVLKKAQKNAGTSIGSDDHHPLRDFLKEFEADVVDPTGATHTTTQSKSHS